MKGASELVGPGRVAVVTGAASGIGFGLAERFATEGMRVVMADIEEPALAEAADVLAGRGAEVLPVAADVSQADQVDALRDRSLKAFGAVHVVCNNAGVAGLTGTVWELSTADWEWVLGVNLWGVINGIRSFMPVLLEQDAGHVVNTASVAGLIVGTLGSYSVSKHGVVALSEALYLQLQQHGPHIGVSVLCPGWVKTQILDAERNRPERLGTSRQADPTEAALREMARQLVDGGMEPAAVAAHVVDGIRARRFYVLTHPEMSDVILRRTEQVLAGGPPNPALA